MSEKRFIAIHGVKYHRIEDNEKGQVYYSEDAQSIDWLVGLLNEQQATINELQAKLKEKEEDERLYANEIMKLNKEAKEVLDFKSLGGNY